jgi:uncharacterized protein YgbK (DUF1537 family)
MITDGAGTSAVCVIADDLTGAADTAVHFLRAGEEALLTTTAGGAAGLPGTAALALDTRTRGSSPGDAVAAVQKAARLARRLGPATLYKKVDSQLRGRPGLEIETLRRELGLRCALVAPAHPDQDRVTRGGVHFVHGVPVAEAEAGRDPIAPVTQSCLPLLIAGQAGVEVAHVPLADFDGGPDGLSARVERLVAEGHPAVTFDAVTRQHLELVADVASGRFADAVLAGSAGLAIALAARRRAGPAGGPAAAPPCGSMLFVCGSTARALRRQAAKLVTGGHCRGVTLTAAGGPGEERREAAIAWERGDLVVRTPEDPRGAAALAPSALLGALAELVVDLVARRRPDGLFLSGGDTATAVLGAAGVTAIRLRGEAMPGVAWGVAVGGTLDGATILTRSGAFGGDDDLVELHRRCGKGARHG